MDNYIFTQNGDNNVQIGGLGKMPYSVQTALNWALGQSFQSVAAQYARTLAHEVNRQADELAALRVSAKLLESDRDAERKIRLAAEADLAAMTAERDAWRDRAEAAVSDMRGYIDRIIHGISGKYACDLCKSGEADLSCKKKACDGFSEWEWRGPKEGGSE